MLSRQIGFVVMWRQVAKHTQRYGCIYLLIRFSNRFASWKLQSSRLSWQTGKRLQLSKTIKELVLYKFVRKVQCIISLTFQTHRDLPGIIVRRVSRPMERIGSTIRPEFPLPKLRRPAWTKCLARAIYDYKQYYVLLISRNSNNATSNQKEKNDRKIITTAERRHRSNPANKKALSLECKPNIVCA